MKLSIVDTANVKVIKPHELEIGDTILYGNHCAKVIEVYHGYPIYQVADKFAVLQVFPEDEELKITIARHPNFYKIIDCETKIDESLIMPDEEIEETVKALEEEYGA